MNLDGKQSQRKHFGELPFLVDLNEFAGTSEMVRPDFGQLVSALIVFASHDQLFQFVRCRVKDFFQPIEDSCKVVIFGGRNRFGRSWNVDPRNWNILSPEFLQKLDDVAWLDFVVEAQVEVGQVAHVIEAGLQRFHAFRIEPITTKVG